VHLCCILRFGYHKSQKAIISPREGYYAALPHRNVLYVQLAPEPFVGTVTLQVTEGSAVTAGQVIATIEAMKMEAAITAPLDGTVARLAIKPVQPVEGGDLLLVIS
jgi:predicted deacylase